MNRPATASVLSLFNAHGHSQYGGEAVTQLEHALQAAWFAERSGAAPALIAASLLHDIGHVLHDLPDDAPDHGIDDVHESLAADWLQERFGAAVVEPVRLHVAAKRYLCATDAHYLSQLSVPSLQSLQLQGGPMTDQEAAEFRQHAYFEDAIQLRQFDDAAKVAHLETPSLDYFVCYLDLTASETGETKSCQD
jgi:[1-hydroxy-2-(trimethylamino)ethyl]phosphonate dioxygenase